MSQQAACVRCDNSVCRAVVIIPALPDEKRHFNRTEQRLEIICPSCRLLFSVPVVQIAHHDVTDDQLQKGFIQGASL